MQIKTILNRIQKHRGFVYGDVQLEEQLDGLALTIDVVSASHATDRVFRLRAAGAALRSAGAAPV